MEKIEGTSAILRPSKVTVEKDAVFESDQKSSSTSEPLVVIVFDPQTKPAAIEWLTAKLEAPKSQHGADLTVKTGYFNHSSGQETVLYINADIDKILMKAEEMRLLKLHNDGSMKELVLTDLDNYVNSENLDDFFTQAEKQTVIRKCILSIRAQKDEKNIPGYEKHTLYPGKSIINKYISRFLVTGFFPLHDQDKVKQLGSEWYTLPNYFKKQPIEKIKEYFGVKVALYFSFLGFYTLSLLPPATIGIIYFFYPWGSMYREASFAAFNMIWSTVFLESWKRYCSSLCFKWGTLDISTDYKRYLEEPRADFYGKMGMNPVTDTPEPVYPKWKRVVKFYCVTVPIITLFLTIAFFGMIVYFKGYDWLKKGATDSSTVVSTINELLLTCAYAAFISILNSIYKKVAFKLNKYENHRLKSSYENSFILKLVLFEFINCFICLFYVAFYKQDRDLLKSFLGTLLITQQISGQLQESMVPFMFMRRRQKMVSAAMQKLSTKTGPETSSENTDSLDSQYQKNAALESLQPDFPGLNDEYLEMYIQFGYVYMFSSAYPLAAFWALLNNATEIRSDSFKMCRIFQRPFPENTNSIGAWQYIFEFIGLISVITNCALIGMDPKIQELLPSKLAPVNIVLIFVAAEHIIIATKASLAYLIPDVPQWVALSIARTEYKNKLALKQHRIDKMLYIRSTIQEAITRRSLKSNQPISI